MSWSFWARAVPFIPRALSNRGRFPVRLYSSSRNKMPHIEHVLFFKLRTLTKEEYEELHSTAMGLKEKIPGILEISLGPHVNFTPNDRSGGYTHGFRVKFVDEEALKVYGPHEEHQKFVTMLGRIREAPPVCLDWAV